MRVMPVERAVAIIQTLSQRYPGKAMVDFGTPEDTLIATLLSARTRDEQVLQVYGPLRQRFPALRDLARASVQDLERSLGTIGLFRSKAKAVRTLAQQLIERHDGRVPATMTELVELAGVGRKTASCVLWYAFGIPAMAVDTHVYRIARRLGWAKGATPERVESELKAYLPEALWGEVNRVFVRFGREFCRSQTPRCSACPARNDCPYAKRSARGTLNV